LLGGSAKGTAGNAARAGIAQTALGAAERTGVGTALRTTGNLALSAYDAYDTVAVLTDEEASWEEKAVAAPGVLPLPLGEGISKLEKLGLASPVGCVVAMKWLRPRSGVHCVATCPRWMMQ